MQLGESLARNDCFIQPGYTPGDSIGTLSAIHLCKHVQVLQVSHSCFPLWWEDPLKYNRTCSKYPLLYVHRKMGRIMLYRPAVCPSVRLSGHRFHTITQKVLQLSTSNLIYSFPIGPWGTLFLLGSWPWFSRSQRSQRSNSVSGA